MTCDAFHLSDNPRQANACRKCGRIRERHPQPLPGRNPVDERRIAFSIAGEEVGSVFQFAQQRAHPGPIREHKSRDFMVETMEELADAVNYAIWGIQQLDLRGVGDAEYGELFAAYGEVLAKVKDAYNRLGVTRGLYLEVLA